MKRQKVLPLQRKYRFKKRVQPWTWAQEHEERVRKNWRWRLLDAMWENRNAQLSQCVPLSHYGWKVFGFDGKHQPVWTIADYIEKWYSDPLNGGDK